MESFFHVSVNLFPVYGVTTEALVEELKVLGRF
jgi:hypothetical protein